MKLVRSRRFAQALSASPPFSALCLAVRQRKSSDRRASVHFASLVGLASVIVDQDGAVKGLLSPTVLNQVLWPSARKCSSSGVRWRRRCHFARGIPLRTQPIGGG